MIVKKRFLGHEETQGLVSNIIRHLQKNNISPAVVIGVTRGGLTPAVMLSHYFSCPLLPLDFSLRDRDDAQDMDKNRGVLDQAAKLAGERGHVLVIDDINDSGDTLTAIDEFVIDYLVRPHNWVYAALLEKCTSKFDCDFYGEMLMDTQCDDWIVFPWEDWWQNKA
jgi:hypoxanthine phosphoribosyltransferase